MTMLHKNALSVLDVIVLLELMVVCVKFLTRHGNVYIVRISNASHNRDALHQVYSILHVAILCN
jgi:hypothetical protein